MADEIERTPTLGIGDLDQIRASLRDVSIILSDYYRELRDAGFSRKEAMTLVIEFQRTVIQQSI